MTIDEAKQLIIAHGMRPLEQRGFYSHFLRAIDDTRTYWSVTVDINKRGQINRRELTNALKNRKLRTDG